MVGGVVTKVVVVAVIIMATKSLHMRMIGFNRRNE